MYFYPAHFNSLSPRGNIFFFLSFWLSFSSLQAAFDTIHLCLYRSALHHFGICGFSWPSSNCTCLTKLWSRVQIPLDISTFSGNSFGLNILPYSFLTTHTINFGNHHRSWVSQCCVDTLNSAPPFLRRVALASRIMTMKSFLLFSFNVSFLVFFDDRLSNNIFIYTRVEAKISQTSVPTCTYHSFHQWPSISRTMYPLFG